MRDEIKRNLRVGLLAAAALAVLAVTILTIGDRQLLFTRQTRYHSTFRDVTGLQTGSPVKLDGVTVGFVERIELPLDPDQRVRVVFTFDANYTERVRTDTTAAIKTMGLLGDKYLEISGGSPRAKRLLEGGLVKGRDRPEVEQFVSGGEDLMENLLAISSSLKVILRRVEAGEGLLGELTQRPEAGERISTTLAETLVAVRNIARRVEAGEGFVGRMLADPELASLPDTISETMDALRTLAIGLAADVGREDTVYAALLRDSEGEALLLDTIRSVHQAGTALSAAAEELGSGQGTLPRLMGDAEYATSFLDDLHELVAHLRSASAKLDAGQGTAGAMVNDPQLYQDLENVVRGVKSSKVLSWFIRNRRKAGEDVSLKEAEQARAADDNGPAR